MEDNYREGSTLMYTKPVKIKEEFYTVTVVGEIPESTAEYVTTSLRIK